MSNFFKFEDEGIDFPFYNDIPKLSKVEWVILALAPFLVGLITLTGGKCIPFHEVLPTGTLPVCYFLVTIIPFAYVCHGKLGLIFKKPRLKDFKVIIICIILYFVWGGVATAISNFLGFSADANMMSEGTITIIELLFTLIQLVAEELFKVSVLLIAMALIYYFTKNRINALVFGIFASMILFGLIHLTAYNYNLFQCIFIIGIGSIIHLYPYIKTKNVVNSYLVHITIDLSSMALMAFAQYYHYALI